MDTLFEIVAGIVGAGLGVLLLRLLKPKSVAKENQAVIVKVEEKQRENDKLAAEIVKIMQEATEKNQELEKEKNKEVDSKEVDDFFNNRKH